MSSESKMFGAQEEYDRKQAEAARKEQSKKNQEARKEKKVSQDIARANRVAPRY